MCRNIKTLFNFDPPATEEEVHAAARTLIHSLRTAAPPRDRETEKARLMEASRRRFGDKDLKVRPLPADGDRYGLTSPPA